MFRAKTVLVIGAGASAEVGLPMGPQLLQQIVQLTNMTFDYNQLRTGDHVILDALKLCLDEGREVVKINEHLKAAWQLGSGLIDQSQNMTVAARAMAEKKAVGHRS